MRLTDSIRYMPREKQPRPPGQITPRQAVGDVVADLIPYRGLSIVEAGNRHDNISPMTIHRIIDGVETVRVQKLLTLERILEVPPRTFLLMLDGNVEAIKALPMEETIRHMVLSALQPVTMTRNRRAADA